VPAATIDKNDITTWPRFEFKELGLSIQLPFEKGDFQIIYNECRNGKFYTKLDNSLDFKQMTGFEKTAETNEYVCWYSKNHPNFKSRESVKFA
jgi:hypothetical protein